MSSSTPFALPTPSDDDDPSLARKPRRRRLCLICTLSTTFVLLVIFLVLLTVFLTVYKVKQPVLSLNSLSITSLNSGLPANLNITVLADVSVKNPNAASFRFGSTTTAIYYRSQEMAVAKGPPGTARAHRTFRMNVTVDVLASQILSNVSTALTADLIAGSVGVETSTKVGGRVRVLGVIQKHVDVVMNCSVTVAIANQSILSQDCKQKYKL